MPSRDPDQKKPSDEQANRTITQKVAALQQRVREMGPTSDGSSDKAFMDKGWGEDSGVL